MFCDILSNMNNTISTEWSKGKVIKDPVSYYEQVRYANNEMERALPISQPQLNNAKLFNSKYEYAKTLSKNINYLEVGVGYGWSAKMFIDTTNAKSADLLDLYNNAQGTREPGGSAPEDSSITHEEYIKHKFSYHPDVRTIKGDMKEVFFTLDKKYDLILFDAETDRFLMRNILKHCSKIVNINGVIGFTSYMNYDAVHYDVHVGIYQSVNEFLHFNQNWSVDAIVLHELGFHEIYIKRNS
jgi:hypothetical protein